MAPDFPPGWKGRRAPLPPGEGGASALVLTAQGAQSQGPGVREPAPLWSLLRQQHVDPPSGASAGAAGCRAWGPLFQTPGPGVPRCCCHPSPETSPGPQGAGHGPVGCVWWGEVRAAGSACGGALISCSVSGVQGRLWRGGQQRVSPARGHVRRAGCAGPRGTAAGAAAMACRARCRPRRGQGWPHWASAPLREATPFPEHSALSREALTLAASLPPGSGQRPLARLSSHLFKATTP